METEKAAKYYDRLLKAHKDGNEDDVLFSARCLMSFGMDNPFPDHTRAKALYFDMNLSYLRWRASGLQRCPNRDKLIKSAHELAELNEPNPWTEPKEVVHVLGVVPEEKKSFFKRRKKKEN